jgi:hypothetical protein
MVENFSAVLKDNAQLKVMFAVWELFRLAQPNRRTGAFLLAIMLNRPRHRLCSIVAKCNDSLRMWTLTGLIGIGSNKTLGYICIAAPDIIRLFLACFVSIELHTRKQIFTNFRCEHHVGVRTETNECCKKWQEGTSGILAQPVLPNRLAKF